MVAVRYAALAALVIWLGAIQTAIVAGRATGRAWIEYACGGILLVSLLAMKFVGPPPRGFRARLVIALAMWLAMIYDRLYRPSTPAIGVEMILGFVLLAWYAHE